MSEPDSPGDPASDLLVVGVGASAGGLEALKRLFASIPADSNLAFIVATHRAAERESHLGEILVRHTTLEVSAAEDGQRVQAGHVYLVPPGAFVMMSGYRMLLRSAVADERERNPIDVLLASLGKELRDNAIGIILSGSGSDGTLGIKAIKEEGGLTIAQGYSDSGPGHSSMPESAVAGGLVDMVVPVEGMGQKLQDYARSFGSLRQIAIDSVGQQRNDSLGSAVKDIYSILRKRVGHDFEGYKEKTFLRRVQRRMQVLQIDSIPEYAGRLQQSTDEAGLLFRDLLIGVTAFFRDHGAFETIATKVIPRLFENAGAADVVRVWVPGCSTGEEAYSLAILIREHLSTLREIPRVQIFATDIDDKALATARSGRYPIGTLEDVAPEHLARYFRTETGGYVLSKDVRDLCIFSAHSVIRDPPFSRIDFISCRNLLIYLNSEVQDTILPVFHYALKPGGFLFLGPAENISRHTELFAVIDKKHRLFQRRPAVNAQTRTQAWLNRAAQGASRISAVHDAAGRKDPQLRHYVEARVLDHFAPAHIVVDAEGDIVHYSPRTGKYLEPQMGIPSRQILSMARRGLRLDLRSALREAIETQKPVVCDRVEVELEDRVQPVRLVVEPINCGELETLYLIVFTDIGRSVSQQEAAEVPLGINGDMLSLEQELHETRDRLQSSIEEYETALEELKSGNEELVSVNEELQSTNEELETSKEELQSVNEELNTVNNELSSRIEESQRANADLRNLFDSTQIATVFLDRFMVIRSFTPAVMSIFNLIAADRGRPLTDIVHQLEDVDLRADIRKVLDERKAIERPVRTRGGRVFHLMRILPYRTADDSVDGVLVTFVDVTAVVAAEEQQRVLVSELNHRVRNMLQVVIGLANQTLHRSNDLKQFEQSFMGRMQALARAYELLSRDGWRNVPVGDLLRTQLSPFVSDDRYNGRGERIIITANAALALGLVLYELATNATKYGALSVAEGRIDIMWELTRQPDGAAVFLFQWEESGGPAVVPPTRHGFGSELVQRQLRYELHGSAAMEFAPGGLKVSMALPALGSVVESERDVPA